MKQKNRVFIDIRVSKMKERFMSLFVHFLCTLFVTCFELFLREKCFFQVKLKYVGQSPAILGKYKLIRKALQS